jgi:hypothetical protein
MACKICGYRKNVAFGCYGHEEEAKVEEPKAAASFEMMVVSYQLDRGYGQGWEKLFTCADNKNLAGDWRVTPNEYGHWPASQMQKHMRNEGLPLSD